MVLICALIIVLIVIGFFFNKRKPDTMNTQSQESIEMAQGIQIFNASGDLIFDMSKNTTYVLGTGQTNAAAGSLQDSRITDNRVWVILISNEEGCIPPRFTVSNGTISWTYNSSGLTPYASIVNQSFMYGVY